MKVCFDKKLVNLAVIVVAREHLSDPPGRSSCFVAHRVMFYLMYAHKNAKDIKDG